MPNIIASVNDGKIVDQTKAKQAANAAIGAKSAADRTVKNSNNSFDKEMFLKLLAAEMQYQDPLQPTQNSEYVSEMATFSQVEATSNVSTSVDSIQANNLVGKYVTINTDDGQTSGIVDVVTKTDKKYQITVDGKTYSASDVVSIQDSDYAEAQVMADSFKGLISKLPAVENLSASDASSLSAVRTLYNSLTAYQKQFINDADLAKLSSLENRMDAINKAKNSSDN